MRAFVGLDIDTKSKLAIEHWRSNAMPVRLLSGKNARQVPAANFHITLAFLDQITPQQQALLSQQLSGLQLPVLTLRIATTGYFSKPKVLWIGPESVPASLAELVRQVKSAARSSGIALKQERYQPHITLTRKITAPPPSPLLPPNFELQFSQFHLFASISETKGVYYPIQQSWDLLPL